MRKNIRNGRSGPLKTVRKAFEIVEWIMSNEGGRVYEIAEQFDIPKSTAHNYLVTLHDMGYLVKDGEEYQVGLRFLWIGGHAATRKEIYTMSKSKVLELAEETDERAQFITEENGYGIYLQSEVGSHTAVETDVHIGKTSHLHTTSAGKAILAYLSEERVNIIIEKMGLPARTENTITDRDRLFDELEKIREHGYAFNNEERIEGQRAVGVPVTDTDNAVLGALSISGPKNRLKGKWYRNEIPDLLLGAANELELNLAYP